MAPDKEVIVARTMLHSTYIADIGNGVDDAVCVSEIVENDKGETRPNLRVFKSPQVSFWVTQPAYRTHTDKKEFESVKVLDEYRVPYKTRDKEIYKVLHGQYPNFLTYKQRRDLLTSPYVYGASISIEALVGIKYKKDLLKSNKISHTPTTGFFDIEKSLLEDSFGKLPLMVFSAENKVFLAMKKSFMYEERDGKHVKVTVEDVEKATREHIDPLVDSIFKDEWDSLKNSKHKLPFTYNFFVGETEVDMIKWIFGKMHETKVSFIGVWNIGFDIPEIIKILDENNIPHEDIFCDPELRKSGYAYTNYREDKIKRAHISQKWHWLTATAHFQFVDSMALYSYIRIVDGKEASYALDDVLKKFGIGGKLKIDKTNELEGLGTEDWHRAMLSRFFTYYAVYAMWDAVGLQILEWRNNDLTSMMLSLDATPPKFFPNNTIKSTAVLFEDWQHKGYILGTGVDVEGISDDELLTGGGAVLDPQNLVANGVCLFEEWPSHHTHVFFWQNDFDFSAQYPNAIITMNISKQTKVSTIVGITAPWVQTKYDPKEAIEVLCSYLITPNANGVELGQEFFDLPSYGEINIEFEDYLKTI